MVIDPLSVVTCSRGVLLSDVNLGVLLDALSDARPLGVLFFDVEAVESDCDDNRGRK